MHLLRRLTPILVTLAVGVSLFLIAVRPSLVLNLFHGNIALFLGLCVGLALFWLAVGMVHIGAFHAMDSRLRFLPFPLILVSSVFLTMSFLERGSTMLAIGLLTSVVIWLWYESLYMFWQQPEQYQPYTLQRLSVPLYLIAIFFLTTALNGLYVYLQMKFGGVLVFGGLALGILFLDVYTLCQFEKNKAQLASAASTFVALEALLAISYLPTHIYMQAILMCLMFYALVGLTRLWAQQDLRRSQVLPYILVSCVGFLVTIGSTLWIV